MEHIDYNDEPSELRVSDVVADWYDDRHVPSMRAGLCALAVYQALYDVRGSDVLLRFHDPTALYTLDFFTVLLGLMARDPDYHWFCDVLRDSDLADDPVLADLCAAVEA